MSDRIITKLTKTCGACPSQWDAEDSDGKVYYIRYRFGYLSVAEGDDLILEKSYGHGLNGSMDFEELKTLMKDVFTFMRGGVEMIDDFQRPPHWWQRMFAYLRRKFKFQQLECQNCGLVSRSEKTHLGHECDPLAVAIRRAKHDEIIYGNGFICFGPDGPKALNPIDVILKK